MASRRLVDALVEEAHRRGSSEFATHNQERKFSSHLLRSNNGFEDLHVSGAATEITGESIPDVGLSRIWIAIQEVHSSHHHAGRADAALRATAFNERLLHCMQ